MKARIYAALAVKGLSLHRDTSKHHVAFRKTELRPKSCSIPPSLNNNLMTAVIGRFRHVTGWTTLRLVGGGILDLVQIIFFHYKSRIATARLWWFTRVTSVSIWWLWHSRIAQCIVVDEDWNDKFWLDIIGLNNDAFYHSIPYLSL